MSTETYAGTAAPFNFNGLVRHYFMRRGANVADVQVNLLPKGERHRQSHAIAVAVRPAVDSIARSFGANAKIAEIPPGPAGALDPRGRGLRRRRQHPARRGRRGSRRSWRHTPGVVDVDWTVEAPAGEARLPGGPGARRRGGRDGGAGGAGAHHGALGRRRRAGQRADGARGRGHRAAARPREPERRRGAARRAGRHAARARRRSARFVTVDSTTRAPLRMRKNLRPVIYVTGDVAGTIESPVYAILAMNQALDTRAGGGGGHRALQRHGARTASTRRPSSGTASGRSPSRCSATSASPSPRCWC